MFEFSASKDMKKNNDFLPYSTFMSKTFMSTTNYQEIEN